MNKWEKLMEKRWLSNTFTVCAGIVFYMILSHIQAVAGVVGGAFRIIQPIIVGIVIAYLIDPIAKLCEEKLFRKIKQEELRRTAAVVAAIVLVLLAVVMFLVVLVPSLVDSIGSIIANLDVYEENLYHMIDEINAWNIGLNLNISSITAYLEKWINEGMNILAQNFGQILTFSQNIGSSLLNFFIGFILGIYFLLGKRGLLYGLEELRSAAFSSQKLKRQNTFLERCHRILVQYIGYDLLDGLAVGVVNAIAMAILGMPEIALISVIVGVTNLLPTFGPVIGLVIGGVLLFLSKPIYALWFLIMVIVIQTLDGYVLKPRLFGGALGIPAVWTLIAIVIGGNLLGVVGILLAIPFAAVLTFVYKENFLPWLKKINGI